MSMARQPTARNSGEIAASTTPSVIISTLPPITFAPSAHVTARVPLTPTATKSQIGSLPSHIRRDATPPKPTPVSPGYIASANSEHSPPRQRIIISAPTSKQTHTQYSNTSPEPTSSIKSVQDPLAARFEKLKLSSSEIPTSHSLTGKPPLVPQKTVHPTQKQPKGDNLQTAALSGNIMAASNPDLPKLSPQPTQHRPSSFAPRSQPTQKEFTRDTGPIVIDDSDDDENNGEQVLSSRHRIQNRPNPFQRSSRVKRRAEPYQTKILDPSQRRQLGSKGSTRPSPNQYLASYIASDVSYPDLTTILKELESPRPSDRPPAADPGVPPITFTQTEPDAKAVTPVRMGTRDDPIDLDSESESEKMDIDLPGNVSRPAFTGEEESRDALLARKLQDDEDRAQRAIIKTRECAVCGDECRIDTLPSLAGCTHAPQTCNTCYAGWVAAQLQQSGWREAKCPESKCQTKLEYHEIQHIVAPDVFEQYDTYIARAALSEDANFRWCRACSFGQVHMNGEEGNIFTCAACGHKVCIIHESTWHEGETCEEYEYRASGRQERDRKAQEEASLDAIGKLTKKCPGPNCVYNIEKNHGCDHMTCSRCRFEFCWLCLCDYNEIRRKGNSAHADNCQYHSMRLH